MRAPDQIGNESPKSLSMSFVRSLFTGCSGQSQIRLNGFLHGFDSERNEVFIKSQNSETVWMPASRVLEHLTQEEISILRLLPPWNGSNEYEISRLVLKCMSLAICRYRRNKMRDLDSDGRWFRETIVNGLARREYM